MCLQQLEEEFAHQRAEQEKFYGSSTLYNDVDNFHGDQTSASGPGNGHSVRASTAI